MFRGLYVRDRQERETDRRMEGKRERQTKTDRHRVGREREEERGEERGREGER